MDDEKPDPPPLKREVALSTESMVARELRVLRKETNHQLIKWKRLPGKGVLAGVCAGLAYRFGWRPWKMRLAFILLVPMGGLPIVFYLLSASFVAVRKRLPEDFDEKTGS